MTALPTTSTRDRLLESAVDVFAEQGYENARLQDIARGAGLTTGAVYANFRGKGDLLSAAIGARADTEIDAILAEGRRREVRGFLEELGTRLFEPRAGHPLLIDAIAAARRDPELAGALRHRLDAREGVLVELVERAQREGIFDPAVDSRAFARFCLTLAMGALVMRTLQMPAPDGGAWHTIIARLLDAVAEEH
jgi:AcrR family transcriptional regulator